MKLFKCQHCAQLLYFENRQCQNCSHQLGYIPEAGILSALEPEKDEWSALASPDQRYRFCANAAFDACNWLVAADSGDRFCTACRHNRTIPDLDFSENLQRWRKFELAKHRLFYTLIRLELPLVSRAEDPDHGLVFDFFDSPLEGGPKALTSHESGLITVNLREADDAEREKIRLSMSESYRTLLGHLRHESGHYFWDCLVCKEDRLEDFRSYFGDERQDYGYALQAHYSNGPPQDWQQNYISGYAAAHPWEDFAETWAHYLHIVDTLEMAFAFDLHIRPRIATHSSLNVSMDFDPHEADDLNRLIQAWLPLTFAVSSIERCMGVSDLYPFVLSPHVVTKMGFIHELVRSRSRARPANGARQG